MKSIHAVLARNSIWNLVRFAASAGVVFVTTPLIIKCIGDAQYGLWALIFSLIGYAGLLELGIQQATIKLVAQFKGREDEAGLNTIASSCMFLLTCVGVVAALLCWFFLPALIHQFVKDGEILGVLGLLVQLLAVDIAFVFVSQGLTGIVLGLQQYHFKCISDMLFSLMTLGLTILVLAKGYGIVGLAGVKLLLDILACLSLAWISRTGYDRLRLSPSYVSGDGLRSILRIGGKLFLRSDVLLAALAARAAERPVKIALPRHVMPNNTTHRPATIQRIRIGLGGAYRRCIGDRTCYPRPQESEALPVTVQKHG